VDPEALQRRLDLLQHLRHRVAVEGGEVANVIPLVAVLRGLLPVPNGRDRGAETLHLRAGVVVVVLALDLVPRELEQPRDRVADGAVASRRDRNRPGRVGRDHLDLHLLALLRRAGAIVRACGQDLAERLAEPPR
jgi:hypothetical protein